MVTSPSLPKWSSPLQDKKLNMAIKMQHLRTGNHNSHMKDNTFITSILAKELFSELLFSILTNQLSALEQPS